MVVLAVHVRGDTTAHGDELGARRHRRKPAARQEEPQHFGQREPGLARQPARGGVEVEDAVGAWGRDNVGVRPGGHRGVAIGPSEPSPEDGRRARR